MQSFPQKKLFEDLGQKSWLIEWSSENPIRSLVTKVEAKRGTFLFLPYGPLIDNAPQRKEDLRHFFEALKELAREEKASFIRVSPFWKENTEHMQLFRDLGFRKAPIHMLGETLWILDLDQKNEEELMAGMEKKHRNLVRRAMKEGVVIEQTTDPEAVQRFIDLHWQTVKRHSFTPYPKQYFQQQVERFAPSKEVSVLEAKLNGELLASAIIMYYGKSGAYHHGASSSLPEHRKIPASYLLQWEALLEAKKRGCRWYNFWGIAPYTETPDGKREYENPKHPFCGITHFKTGFGGERQDLVPCQDLVLSPKYYLNWGVESFRKWKRGF